MPKLTVQTVRSAKPGRHGDEGGLYLHVRPEGSKAWILRVQVNGHRRDFGLGGVNLDPKYHGDEIPLADKRLLTLAEAREKAAEGRRLAKAGIDPSLYWRRKQERVPTFEEAARRLHEERKATWSTRHGEQWLRTLELFAFPLLGSKTVDQIDAPGMWAALGKAWLETPESARRVVQRIATILDYAKAHKWRETEAPIREFRQLASRQPKKRGRYEAMPYQDLPAFVEKLRAASDTMGRLALRFLILTAARSGEVRGATWGEFDLNRREWNVPAERMKGKLPHTVPLPDAALDILRTVGGFVEGRAGEPVFKGLRGKALSEATLAAALRDAGGGAATVHGMRSAFKDWAREQCPTIPDDVSEAALAHAIANKVKASYQRTKFLEMRRQLMDSWATYLDGGSNVLRLAV